MQNQPFQISSEARVHTQSEVRAFDSRCETPAKGTPDKSMVYPPITFSVCRLAYARRQPASFASQ